MTTQNPDRIQESYRLSDNISLSYSVVEGLYEGRVIFQIPHAVRQQHEELQNIPVMLTIYAQGKAPSTAKEFTGTLDQSVTGLFDTLPDKVRKVIQEGSIN